MHVPERKERAARLRALGEKQLEKCLQRHVNKSVEVIVEKDNFGRTQSFVPVKLADVHKPGELITVKTTGIEDNKLLGAAA